MVEEIKDEEKDKTIDIQAEVEKARKQERDKLHADIERLKAEVAEKAKTCNENYVTISNLQKELENHKKLLGEVDSKVAKAKEDGKVEANKDLDALKAELEDYKAKLAKAEKDFSDYKASEELKAYKNTKIADIDEEFKALVVGNTKEEVDASYEQVKGIQNAVKEKYKVKEPLPEPKSKAKAPQKTDDLLKRLNSMSLEEYAEARKNKFK